GFIPEISFWGRLDYLVIEALHGLWLLAAVATLLCALATALGGARSTRALLAASVVALGLLVVVTATLSLTAIQHGATFPLLRQALPARSPGAPTEQLTFATVDGVDLHAEIWRADTRATDLPAAGTLRTSILFVHGGGFWGGILRSR